jgi:predicted transcriptional regulator
MAMRKTSVYLTDEESKRLAEAAEREGRPQAEIIREAIATYRAQSNETGALSLIASGRGPGTSVADIPEEELLEGFGE